jgi:hypothetical protein
MVSRPEETRIGIVVCSALFLLKCLKKVRKENVIMI